MNQNSNGKKKSFKNYVYYILGPLLGSLLTIGVQQVFFKPNQRIHFQQEIVREQMPYYNKILRFCEIGTSMDKRVILHTTQTVLMNKEGEIDRLEGTKEKSYIIPSIIMNENLFEEWDNLKKNIEQNKDFIDHDIYLAFKDVINFYEKNKPSKKVNSENISDSKWSDRDFVGNWSSENLYLKRMVENFIRLK